MNLKPELGIQLLMELRNVDALRLYGNDPRLNHRDFLDRAYKLGLGVVVATGPVLIKAAFGFGGFVALWHWCC